MRNLKGAKAAYFNQNLLFGPALRQLARKWLKMRSAIARSEVAREIGSS